MKKLLIILSLLILFTLSPFSRNTPLNKINRLFYSMLDNLKSRNADSAYDAQIPKISREKSPEENPPTVKSLNFIDELNKEEKERKNIQKRSFVK